MAMPYKMTEDMIRCQLCSAANGVHPDVYHLPPECKSDNEPTLTCSEVVERLPISANDFKDEYDWKEPHDVTYHAPRAAYSHDELIEFAEAYAKRVLHSWRERRVQELEECLREEIMQAKACVSVFSRSATNSGVGQAEVTKAARLRIAHMEQVLAKSDEWREQIRKGANHD